MQYSLILEDHAETRKWWLAELPRIFPDTSALAAGTVEEARSLLRKQGFWLAIVDLKLPDGSGVDLIRKVSVKYPDTICVVNSIFDDDHHVFSALRAGAKGYLVKDQPRDLQTAQLKQILHGQPPLSPGVARRILSHFAAEGQEPRVNENSGASSEQLTERETEVLRLIAKGFSRPEVAEMLGISVHTVATYTKSIYQKLDISRRAEAVVEAVRLGLVRSN
ncbi:MAG: DNA-binding response regulator [Gammaproteobacteria bacterium]|nr:MAG: DNA-binding response regulator [Gammaproteobacteria bacterium]